MRTPVLYWTFCLCTPLTLMAGPTITVRSTTEGTGVYLLPSTSTDFAKALPPYWARELTPLLQYAVLVVNESNEGIIADAICWNTQGQRGRGCAIEYGFGTHLPSDLLILGPKSSSIVLPPSSIGAPFEAWSPNKQAELEDRLAFFARYPRVEITLDAVLLSDGRAVGEDPGLWIPRWKAYLDAGRDLAALLESKTDLEAKAELDG